MRKFMILLLFMLVVLLNNYIFAQCSASASEVCNSAGGGPFTNWTDSQAAPWQASCLSIAATRPNSAFVVFNIVLAGELNILIDGNTTTGFVDVAIYQIPAGVAPCDVSDTDVLACNFAPASSGCASFGGGFGCLGDQSPGPMVAAGDRILIVAHDYSNGQTSYSVSVGTDPGDATLGAPESDIGDGNPTTVDFRLCTGDGATQIPNTEDYDGNGINNFGGGTWSGNAAVNATTGFFDPAISGVGSFSVDYTFKTMGDPCFNTSTAVIEVDATPDPQITCPVGSVLSNVGLINLVPVDNNAAAAINGAPTVTWGGDGAIYVDAAGNFDPAAAASGTFTVDYTLTSVNGACSETASCLIMVDPVPVPTLGQWGLIILILSLLNMSLVAKYNRQLAFAGNKRSNFSSVKLSNWQFPFNRTLFNKVLIGMAFTIVLLFGLAINFFGYSLTNADIPGSLLTLPIFSYLIHLFLDREQ